jgi:hypothetical protein
MGLTRKANALGNFDQAAVAPLEKLSGSLHSDLHNELVWRAARRGPKSATEMPNAHAGRSGKVEQA